VALVAVRVAAAGAVRAGVVEVKATLADGRALPEDLRAVVALTHRQEVINSYPISGGSE